MNPITGYGMPLEYKIIALRECPVPMDRALCSAPAEAVAYWRQHIETSMYFNPECECVAVLCLNSRRKVKGHQLITIGTADAVMAHAREVFRAAIITSATAVIVMHNHPSGDPTPSDADICMTRHLARAGAILRIELTDHLIVGKPNHVSLKELGYFTL